VSLFICKRLVHSNPSRHASRTLENLDAAKIQLTQAEVDEITAIVDKHGVMGGRYFDQVPQEHLRLWG
jgi:diketogulonate reductase-like aldo/keto reductase